MACRLVGTKALSETTLEYWQLCLGLNVLTRDHPDSVWETQVGICNLYQNSYLMETKDLSIMRIPYHIWPVEVSSQHTKS